MISESYRPEVERELEKQIEPWLNHMRWRADFAEWRQKRLWQENYQRESLAEVARLSNSASQPRMLDLGAGMGGFAVALARAQARVIALDYNPAYCEITRTRARRYDLNLPALVAAGEALPFRDASFSLLTCWDVVEHVQDPARLLEEIARVLDPDGCALITVINRFALVDPHYHLRFVNWLPRDLGEKYIAMRHRAKSSPLRDRQKLSEMHYFTYGAFSDLAARYGFRVGDLNQSHSRFNRYPPPFGDALYQLWRAGGMGTYRLVLLKSSSSDYQKSTQQSGISR